MFVFLQGRYILASIDIENLIKMYSTIKLEKCMKTNIFLLFIKFFF